MRDDIAKRIEMVRLLQTLRRAKENDMAEIGEPIRRRVVIPQTIPSEPSPYVQPAPQHEPAKVEPERIPEKVP